MNYDPDKHHRRSIRLKEYDYTLPGAYYITICVNKRLCLFGHITDDKMQLNDAGKMVDKIWSEIPNYYPGVDLDEYTVMPNHLHGILILKDENVGAPPCGRAYLNSKKGRARGPAQLKKGRARGPAQLKKGRARGPAPTGGRLSLGDIVGRFESFTMNRYIDGVKNHQWKPFHKKLWLRNYYDHIIRNEDELHKIREYIIDNPSQWESDRNNPKNDDDSELITTDKHGNTQKKQNKNLN